MARWLGHRIAVTESLACHKRLLKVAERGAGNPLLCLFFTSMKQDGRGSRRLTQYATLLKRFWKVRECSTCEAKQSEIGAGVLNVLVLRKTMVQGKGERNFGSVIGRVSEVVNGRAREGVALLLS